MRCIGPALLLSSFYSAALSLSPASARRFSSSLPSFSFASSTPPSASASALFAAGKDPALVRWGILSAGRIASDFARALSAAPGSECLAVAASDGDRARLFAERHGIPRSYGSYDALLADPAIDVVYVGTVAQTHCALAQRCLAAGKHVLVEKPLGLSAEETRPLVEEHARAGKSLLAEGMWTRFFPAVRKAREVLDSGAVGEAVAVQADFGWSTEGCGPDHRIWDRRSGGMTLDVAMYLAQLGTLAFGKDAVVEHVQTVGWDVRGVDHTVACAIKYRQPRRKNHGMLQFYVTGAANTEERVVLQCTRGRITIHPPAHTPDKITVSYAGDRTQEEKTEAFEYDMPKQKGPLAGTPFFYPRSEGFAYEIEAVAEAVRHQKKEMDEFDLQESLQVATILDTMLEQLKDARNS